MSASSMPTGSPPVVEFATASSLTVLEALHARFDEAARLLSLDDDRYEHSEQPSPWPQKGRGVLRCPVRPEVLRRSIEVVRGVRAKQS